ncbi:MAG: hypothetical protein OEW69_06880 [Nitrospirota bacterium]|nr:hypothetical protein [Nitrospirota bacterium]
MICDPICLLAGGLTFIFLFISGGQWYTIFLALGIALTVGVPIDRYCDDKFRELK